MYTTRPKKSTDKHIICLQADQNLALVELKINDIHRLITKESYKLIQAPEVPEPHTLPMIQERFNNIEREASTVACYVKIRGDRVANLPTPGEDGRKWLKGYRQVVHDVRTKFLKLRDDIVFLSLCLVSFIQLDTQDNHQFREKYKSTLEAAKELIFAEFQNYQQKESVREFWRYRIDKNEAAYKEFPIQEQLFPDRASLSLRALVMRVSDLCLRNLRQWDRFHGLKIPQVHRILEVFAFEMVDAFDSGHYDLQSRFMCSVQ